MDYNRGQHPVALGSHVALATFLCSPSHDLGFSQCEKGKNILLLRNSDISIQSVPKRCIQKVNIPYCNVYTSFWDTLYIDLHYLSVRANNKINILMKQITVL
jgi:hypothetical protein